MHFLPVKLSKVLLSVLACLLVICPYAESRVILKTLSNPRISSGSVKRTFVKRPAAKKNRQASRSRSKRIGKSRAATKKHTAAAWKPQFGILFASETGETYVDQCSDLEFNPASVAKLVTAYGAIKKFGLEHSFDTKLFLDGTLNERSGVFNGSVYVEGCDPDFRHSDAVALKDALYDAGIKRVAGKLIVSSDFSYSSGANSAYSASLLLRVLKEKRGITFSKGHSLGKAPESAVLKSELHSEPFHQTLKYMLSYSRNDMAEQIGRVAGGIKRLSALVEGESGLSPGSLKLASASGLGKSRVKPKDMLRVLRALRAELKLQGKNLYDICPLAGVDGGTLDERFTDPCERGSVVGKTGTLPGTDGGASALAGIFGTQSEDIYFVIFCWRGSVSRFRQEQDELIRRFQKAHGGARALYQQPLRQEDGALPDKDYASTFKEPAARVERPDSKNCSDGTDGQVGVHDPLMIEPGA